MENMEKESRTVEKPQSGWDTPENVKEIISAAPGVILAAIEQAQGTNKATIEATRVMHGRVTLLAGLICLGGLACAATAAYQGNFDAAEKIVIPLISFAGGFGLATGARK